MIRFPPVLSHAEIPKAHAEIEAALAAGGSLILDLSELSEVDSAGVALLSLTARRARQVGCSLELQGLSPELSQTLSLFPGPSALPSPPSAGHSILATLGEATESVSLVFSGFMMLCADAAWFTVETLFGRHRLRGSVILAEMAAMGSRALGVVGLISFLVGATMALQSAEQLRRFGADIFVVDLIVVSMLRELGPLMAAIVVAGRSGAAVAAELGTMTVTEEVDALRTMGLNPVRYLVVPKILAISLMQPLLTVYANALGILGGFLVALAWLGLGPLAFVGRLVEVVVFKDILVGLFKSVVFAWLIVSIGAWYGLQTRGGADAVGRSTTSAVVAGIFAVVVADALSSLLFYL